MTKSINRQGQSFFRCQENFFFGLSIFIGMKVLNSSLKPSRSSTIILCLYWPATPVAPQCPRVRNPLSGGRSPYLSAQFCACSPVPAFSSSFPTRSSPVSKFSFPSKFDSHFSLFSASFLPFLLHFYFSAAVLGNCPLNSTKNMAKRQLAKKWEMENVWARTAEEKEGKWGEEANS